MLGWILNLGFGAGPIVVVVPGDVLHFSGESLSSPSMTGETLVDPSVVEESFIS